MKLISKYFPGLTNLQVNQLRQLGVLFPEWNAKINLISRKDIDHFYERHVLHSLSIAKWISFVSGTRVLDLGTGGGFPGVPLAIIFPEVSFVLADSIGKKIKVVNEIITSLGLQNAIGLHSRVEDIPHDFDFIVSRAVAKMPLLISWCKGKVSSVNRNATPNGLISLKGGNVQKELNEDQQRYHEIIHLKKYFEEDYFSEKLLIYTQV